MLAGAWVCMPRFPSCKKRPLMVETESADHEFGLGDASFQAVVAYAINDRWAAAVGTRVVAQTAAGSLGSGEWQVSRSSACAICCSNWGSSLFDPTMRVQ